MLEALFAAAAEAVFSYILDTLEPAERLRDWLKRNLVKLAYQHALARTYVAFARQYPELTASLFNESFLTIEAAPELVKFLTRHQHPDHTQLVKLWAKSITPQTKAGQQSVEALSKREDLNAASAYFVELLTSELKHESALQPLFDSRALESLPAIEAKLDQLANALKQAMTIANNYEQTIVNRSGGVDLQAQDVTIGGDVVGRDKIVSNTYNTYFTGEFATLDDLYVRPDAVFQRVQVQDFVGREWLTAKVDAFLNDEKRKSGMFLLVGEAGVGKTSFMAHLVSERRYLHLFAEQVPGEVNVSRALQSLGAQLVARYQIDPYKEKGTLPAIATFPDFLDKLLRLAADKLSTGEKIVIVCDALDEAGTAPNGNVFGLSSVLPDGVYFILSQRPVATVKLSIKADLVKETIDAAGADNLRDVERYLIAVSRRPEVIHQLRAHNYTEADFVRVLKERSGGVWMYLFYVVSEIAGGSRAPLDLATLPSGLAGYYTDYWGDWSEGRNGRGDGPAKWDTVYAPLLATLAAAQLPIDLNLLLAWSKVQTTKYEVERLLRRNWRAFITERKIDHTPHFALYHASLRNFLTGQVDRQGLTLEAEQLSDELSRRTREAHARIVEHYRQQCNGNWVKLVDDDYARTHLCLHLSASGDDETMYQLVAMSNAWAEAKYAQEESYTGYLIDLNRAWRYAESDAQWDIGRQTRCALVESSLHSLASNISADLLRQLVEAQVWTPLRALSHIPQIAEDGSRADSLIRIAPLLPDELKTKALATTCTIQDEWHRARALSALVSTLPDILKAEALAVTCAIQDERDRAQVFSALVPTLPDYLKAEALRAVNAIQNQWIREQALSDLNHETRDSQGPVRVSLAPTLSRTTLINALTMARGIQDEKARAQVLSAIVPALPDVLKIETLTVASAIRDETARAQTLSALAPTLPDDWKHKALTAARAIKNEEDRVEVLCALAPALPVTLKAEALAAAGEIKAEWYRARVLSVLVPALPDALKAEVLVYAYAIHDYGSRVQVLSALGSILSDDWKVEALKATRAIEAEGVQAQVLSILAPLLPDAWKSEALIIARAIKAEWAQAEVLSALAPSLPDALKVEALAVARAIQDNGHRAEVLSALALNLPGTLKTKVLAEALESACAIQDEGNRARILSFLVPTLPDALKVDALVAAQAIQSESDRARVLCALAPVLPDALKIEAFSAVRMIQNESERTQVLSVLAPILTDTLKAEALADARAVQIESYRVNVLCALAPVLPKTTRVKTLNEVLAIIHDVSSQSFPKRPSLYHAIISPWRTERFHGFQLQLWPETLHALARYPRGEFGADLAVLIPLIEHLGGQAAIEELFCALRDVAEWWP